MSFEDVQAKVQQALAKHNIVFRTEEEETLANFATLLTQNAQREALEYEDNHYLRLAKLHEDRMLNPDTAGPYMKADPSAPLPDNMYEENGKIWIKNENGKPSISLRNPRGGGPLSYVTEGYEKNGFQGIVDALKERKVSLSAASVGNHRRFFL